MESTTLERKTILSSVLANSNTILHTLDELLKKTDDTNKRLADIEEQSVKLFKMIDKQQTERKKTTSTISINKRTNA